MSDKPLSKEELLRISAEVLEGKRPHSDMKKYGLNFGETIEGEQAKQMFISELKALGFWDGEEEPPPTAEKG